MWKLSPDTQDMIQQKKRPRKGLCLLAGGPLVASERGERISASQRVPGAAGWLKGEGTAEKNGRKSLYTIAERREVVPRAGKSERGGGVHLHKRWKREKSY